MSAPRRKPRPMLVAAFVLAVMASLSPAFAQEGELEKSPPKGITPDEVIQKFAAKEKEWEKAREQYTFRQEIRIQTLTLDQVVGEYRQVADISYSQDKRIKTVVLKPQPSLVLSPEDVEDLDARSSFTIGTDELAVYNVTYAGQQKLDELHCYVFDVVPKQIEKGMKILPGQDLGG